MSPLNLGVSRTLFLGTALTLAALHTPPAIAVTVIGMSRANQLVTFDSAAPGTILSSTTVTGLQVGENVLAIDIRPLTGQLYGLGSTSRLYTIETATGAATQVGATSFVVPLTGMYFGFNFDPVADRIRVVSDTGQNFRLDPDTGAVVDSDPGKLGIQPDTNLSLGSTVVACAYTNNFPGAATTTLYGIDSASDMLVRLGGPDGNPSPELGVVTPIGDLGLGPITSYAGLDISANEGRAYATLTKASTGAVSRLYTINLADPSLQLGSTTDLGPIGDGSVAITEIAVLSRPVTIFGVTGANELVRFSSLKPETIISTLPITGVQPDEDILGIDARPATGRLYALGSTSRLYTIDTTTGAATQVGAEFAVPLDAAATGFGFNFNPVTDRIRVVDDASQNFRLVPDTGEQVDFDPNMDGVQLDNSLHDSKGNPRAVVGCAYTNDLPGGRSTTLFGIDAVNGKLVRVGGPNGTPPPNGGVVTNIGPLGVTTTSMVGFDIAPVDGTAFASFTVGGTPGLYTLNLATPPTVTGTPPPLATLLGPIGAPSIRAIAVAPPGRFEFAAPTFTALEHADAATVTIIRSGGDNGPASVRFTASSGTATAGVDFEGVSQTVVFLDGEDIKTVDVPLIDDSLVDGTETVNLTLGAPTTSLGSASTAVLTIVDDDGTPQRPACSVDAECDDHDRCTTDTCSGGSCTNLLSPHFETVLCELDSVRKASLCGDDPIKKKLVRSIRRRITHAGALVQRAAAGRKRAASRADALLAAIQAKVRKAAEGIKISRLCGEAIDLRVQGIRDLLTAATPAR